MIDILTIGANIMLRDFLRTGKAGMNLILRYLAIDKRRGRSLLSHQDWSLSCSFTLH